MISGCESKICDVDLRLDGGWNRGETTEYIVLVKLPFHWIRLASKGPVPKAAQNQLIMDL